MTIRRTLSGKTSYVADYLQAKLLMVLCCSRTEVNVFEDEPIGFPLVYLLALDPDWEENGRVSYEIIGGNEAKKFEVESRSGAVTLVQRLDREDSRKYRLDVRAFDHGNPQLSASQSLLINVEDINDNSPRFEQSVYRVNITENVPIGTFVAQLKAYDSDGGKLKLTLVLPHSDFKVVFQATTKSSCMFYQTELLTINLSWMRSEAY